MKAGEKTKPAKVEKCGKQAKQECDAKHKDQT
jgi:hypothetical protein